MPLNILFLAGSVRQGSFNRALLAILARHCEAAGHRWHEFDLKADPLPLFDQDLEAAGVPESVQRLRTAIKECDGVVLVCPEYNAGMTPLMKNAIDWASRDRSVWKGKVVGLFSASPGRLGGIRGLRHTRLVLTEVGAVVPPGEGSVPGATEAFDAEGNLKDERTRTFVTGALEEFLHMATALKPRQ